MAVRGDHDGGDVATGHAAPMNHAALRLTPGDKTVLGRWLHGRPEHTQRAYQADLIRFLAFVRAPLATVALADLQDYADALDRADLAPATRVRLLNAVKSLLTFAHESGYLAENAGRALRLPAVRTRLVERIPTEDDVAALLAHETDPRNHALIRLLYVGGLRLSETCALRWRDLTRRGAAGQVTVWGKGNHERAVLLTGGVWRELMALRPPDADPDDPVFRSRRGGPLSPTQAWRVVKNAAARAQVSSAAALSPHWLRHAHASHALDRGAPVSLVRECLGHASLATTSRYTHARPGDSSARYLPL